MKEKFAALGTFVVSLLLSFCCTIPLALASLGLGSLGLGSFVKPLRPYLIVAALIFISLGLVRVYTRTSDRKSRILLWTAAAVFLLSVATPYAIGFFSGEAAGELPYVPGPGERRVLIQLEGPLEACPAGCEGRAQLALKSLPGVRHVRVDHARKEAELWAAADAELSDAETGRVLRAVGHNGRIKR